jgi:hypothetical protein
MIESSRWLDAMTISSENIFSWQATLWILGGAHIVAATWSVTVREKPVWKRIFVRAAAIAFCFIPLPHPEMFTMAGAAGYVAVIPLWYVLPISLLLPSIPLLVICLSVWLVAAYVFWVAGMSIHSLGASKPSI